MSNLSDHLTAIICGILTFESISCYLPTCPPMFLPSCAVGQAVLLSKLFRVPPNNARARSEPARKLPNYRHLALLQTKSCDDYSFIFLSAVNRLDRTNDFMNKSNISEQMCILRLFVCVCVTRERVV